MLAIIQSSQPKDFMAIPRTQIRIGIVTKAMTKSTVMMAWERGRRSSILPVLGDAELAE